VQHAHLQIQRLQEETVTEYPRLQSGRLQPQGQQYRDCYSAIKRKIDIDKVKAVTVSKIGTEFIIHVPD
jgi:hypothetical protein